MKITVIAVGKVKETWLREAVGEYAKRLSKYCKLAVVEVEDERTPDRASDVAEEQIREKEAKRILKHVSEDAHVITLEIKGRKMCSEDFAEHVEKLGVQGKSHVQFVIGGSLGLHSLVSERADLRLSFSDMTFPHQMMRVILLEQVYRGYRIIAGEPYHK